VCCELSCFWGPSWWLHFCCFSLLFFIGRMGRQKTIVTFVSRETTSGTVRLCHSPFIIHTNSVVSECLLRLRPTIASSRNLLFKWEIASLFWNIHKIVTIHRTCQNLIIMYGLSLSSITIEGSSMKDLRLTYFVDAQYFACA
jgi:hypothetical protein